MGTCTKGWEGAGLNEQHRTKLSRLSEVIALSIGWLCPVYVKNVLWSLDAADELVLARYLVKKQLAPPGTEEAALYLWNNYFLGSKSALWIYNKIGDALTNKYEYISEAEYAAQKDTALLQSRRNEIELSTGYIVEVKRRTFQLGEGWHGNENAVRFWNP